MMQALVQKFILDERGTTAIEYAMIASLISIAIVAAATQLGKNLGVTWDNVAGNMK